VPRPFHCSLMKRLALLSLYLTLPSTTLLGQTPRADLQYFRVDPDFAHTHGCTYSDVSAPPKLTRYLEHPDSVSPQLRTACDVLAWFGKPGKVQYNGDASLAEAWFYFLRRDYSFTLTLRPAPGNRWLLDQPLVLGVGRSTDSAQ